MFQKKSFNLINEDESKKSKSPECGWLRFLVIPGLICFALLLILVNIDFSQNVQSPQNNATSAPNVTTDDLQSTLLSEEDKDTNLSSLNSPIIANSYCTPINKEKCKVKCVKFTSFDRKNLIKDLEHMYKTCNSLYLELILENVEFEKSTFEKADLNGNFLLSSLTFKQCHLDAVMEFAFDKNPTNRLEELIIIDSSLVKITPNTFYGLIDLKIFTITNEQYNTALSAKSILKPVEKTLIEFNFLHKSSKRYKSDPGIWLQDNKLYRLKRANFKDNFFTDTLKSTSFAALKNVEILILENCSIEVMEDDTFDLVLDTLKYLDLSYNRLKDLSPFFLRKLPKSEVELNIENNYLDCACDKCEMLEILKNDAIKFTSEPMCSTPINVSGLLIKSLEICSTSEQASSVETTEKKEDSFPLVELNCRKCLHNDNPFAIQIQDQSVCFTIQTLTETSVEITFVTIPSGASIFYFSDYNNNSQQFSSNLSKTTLIEGLNASHSYIFCLVESDVDFVSPLDCHSKYVSSKIFTQSIRPWLKKSDFVLFVTFTTIAAVLFLFIGLIAMYFVLRSRPTILRAKQNFFKSKTTEDGSFIEERTQIALTNDYVRHLKRSEVPKTKVETVNRTENKPPHLRAPALPPLALSRPISSQSTILVNNLYVLETKADDFNEHEYQCLDD